MVMDAPVVVAYTCSEKKRTFFQELARAADDIPGLTCVPYESLGAAKHDALVHKRTDDFVASLTGDSVAAKRFHEFTSMLPDSVVAVDNLGGIRSLVDRVAMARVVTNVLASAPELSSQIRNLRWACVRADAPRTELLSSLAQLTFPVIVKRRLACGTPESHMMAIAYDVETAIKAVQDFDDGRKDEYSSTMFVQEFIANHGGALFKLYAVGDRVVVQARSSVEQDNKPTKGGDFIHFDSQELSMQNPDDPSPRRSDKTVAPMPATEMSRRIASMMRKELGLELIGVDLIFDATHGSYSIVDVNYFPGYKGVENANRWILLHALEKVRERRRRNASNAVYRMPVAQWTVPSYVAGFTACGDRHLVEVPAHMIIRPDVRNVRQILGKGA